MILSEKLIDSTSVGTPPTFPVVLFDGAGKASARMTSPFIVKLGCIFEDAYRKRRWFADLDAVSPTRLPFQRHFNES